MPFEKFDKKIKDSLDQGSHFYDESSWQKMKALLDKHMPEKKDNRRQLFIFLFIFLLLGGGSIIIFTGTHADKEVKPPTSITNVTNSTTNEESQHSIETFSKPTSITSVLNSESTLITTKENSSDTKKKSILAIDKTAELSEKMKSVSSNSNNINKKEADKSSEFIEKENKNSVDKSITIDNILTDQKEVEKPKTIVEPGKEVIQDELKKETTDLEKEQASPEIKKAAIKKKQSFLKNMLLNLSAATDISSVGNQTGRVKLMPGIGIGYNASEHFTIRSGLSVGKKIYTAIPEDYNPPQNFWAYYPNLKHIDADCKVIDISINLDYKFELSKKQNWFVSAGVSSLIMKKEDYNYYYKPTNSQQYIYYKRSFENINKHYFSVLNLSGGYSRKISPALTIQAEPYLKIAMKGVGYGKVKLNSTGVMLTASFQPFQSKKIIK